MQYRKHGNTGIHISALGFGCMRLPEYEDEKGVWHIDQEKVNEMLMRAYDLGVNYFDTAPYYCHHNSEIAIGRKTDFLIQEFNRESNTIGSKCNNSDIAKIVIELKSEIEKIREQIQNIE